MGPEARLHAQQPVAAAQDTVARGDTLAAVDTTAVAEADSLAPLPVFPAFPPLTERSPILAASWGLSDILATGALTLADLIEYSPFLHPVRAGFLEGPQTEVFSGSGALGLRYQVDGYEIAPIAGGPLDLHLLPLVELETLRLVRAPGGYLLSAQTYQNPSASAYSRIEAGTGDRDANVIRAFFASRFSGGPVGFGFDRVDTDGQRELGSAERSVVWARYSRALPSDVWGQVEIRNTSSDRDSFPAASRTDWILRFRRAFGGGWHADLIGGGASVQRTPVSLAGVPDTLADRERDFGARQVAARIGRVSDLSRLTATIRAWDGDGVPKLESEISVDLAAGPADLHLSGYWGDWGTFQTEAGYAALSLGLPLGLRLLAEAEDGGRGVFGGLPVSREFFTRVTGGAELSVGSWAFGGRGGRWRVEPSPTLGLPFDSAGPPLSGRTVSVVEGWAAGPIFRVFGGELTGGVRYGARDMGPFFFYWPEDWWRVHGRYHLVAIHDQLEIWLQALGGVRGPLAVPDVTEGPDASVSPDDLNWFSAEAVVRIRDVYLYYNYEFFDAATVIGELPRFELPRSRFHFGVKWEFWN